MTAERSRGGFLRPFWLVTIVVALGASALGWRIGRGPRGDRDRAADAVAKAADPATFVSERAGKTDPETVKELVHAYETWAPRPDTLEARQGALKALLAQPSVKVALESVMSAVDADPTPREMDPMWPDLVKGVASLWDAVTFIFGRDQIYLETRAKPHDLMVASMAEVAQSGISRLTADQRMQLASDLIDLYPGLKPAEKPAVERALDALVGSDVVEILNGRGGDHLHIVSAQKQAAAAVLGGARR